jgi:hypothetical protein
MGGPTGGYEHGGALAVFIDNGDFRNPMNLRIISTTDDVTRTHASLETATFRARIEMREARHQHLIDPKLGMMDRTAGHGVGWARCRLSTVSAEHGAG